MKLILKEWVSDKAEQIVLVLTSYFPFLFYQEFTVVQWPKRYVSIFQVSFYILYFNKCTLNTSVVFLFITNTLN